VTAPRPGRRGGGPARRPAGRARAGAARHRPSIASGRGRRPDDLLLRAARIRLVLLDVDGVLTDGRIWYGPDGEALKAFDVRDGHGIVRLRHHVDFGVISGRPGTAARRRLEELRFKHLVFGQIDKLAGYATLASLGVADDEVAYMGDDVNDLPLLRKVGLSACPSDARPEVRREVRLVTRSAGGRGAVRELCEVILRAKGLAGP
jgi:3-deoxy-D-manno-octulosonate 8-phosphate phosphatase (KDO 8-P phosphatase)